MTSRPTAPTPSTFDDLSTRPWLWRKPGHYRRRRRGDDEESWTSKLNYDAFVFWRGLADTFRGRESNEIKLQKQLYVNAVSSIHEIFQLLFQSCAAYASDTNVQIVGLTARDVGFDEKQTVNANFRGLREMLAMCDQKAEAQLRRLEVTYSTALTYFAADRKAVEALADSYLTTGSPGSDLVPANDGDEERNDVAMQLLRHVSFRRYHELVHDDVETLAELRGEAFAKFYDYWERPPKELIELVLRAKDTVDGIKRRTFRRRLHLMSINFCCNDRGRRFPASLYNTAQHLRRGEEARQIASRRRGAR